MMEFSPDHEPNSMKQANVTVLGKVKKQCVYVHCTGTGHTNAKDKWAHEKERCPKNNKTTEFLEFHDKNNSKLP